MAFTRTDMKGISEDDLFRAIRLLMRDETWKRWTIEAISLITTQWLEDNPTQGTGDED